MEYSKLYPSGSEAVNVISRSVSSSNSTDTGSTIGGSFTGFISTLNEVLTVARLILSLAVISTTPLPKVSSSNDSVNIDSEITADNPLTFSLTE